MGHMAGKDVYKSLVDKIDNSMVRIKRDRTFYELLRELYSAEEAEVVVKMPYSMSEFGKVAKAVGYENSKLRGILEGLCAKGLVIDLWIRGKFYYMPSPLVVGIFEFTLMRTGDNLNTKEWARLFDDYMEDGGLHDVNFQNNELISPLRSLPHEETVKISEHTEILDYEKATAIVESADKLGVGLCACRHKKHHLDDKKCDIPLETCLSFGTGADYLIRNNLAKEVSKSEILESMARSKEAGLVFNADNIQNNVTFVCQCCACCCVALAGISKFGYPNALVTSSFIADIDADSCDGCGKCSKACPINAIDLIRLKSPKTKKKKEPKVNEDICLGCGVCALKCDKTKALKLVKRRQRVIHPATTFERVILQCLERGTLQNQIFDNPQSVTHKIMRGVVGGFLKLKPVKKALMSDALRSSFLNSIKKGARLQGRGLIVEL